VRRIALAARAGLVLAPAAHAACGVAVSAASGAAPLRATFTATCASAAYHWDFGDGQVADGASVTHVFAPGRFAPTLTTGTGAQQLPAVTSVAITLSAPHRADYAAQVTLRARVVPDLSVRLTNGRVFRAGALRVTVTHSRWTAVAGGVAAHVAILVRPRLEVRLDGSPTVGSPLRVLARLHPARAGRLRIHVDGRPTVVVGTAAPRTARIVVSTQPHAGWSGPGRILHATIVVPHVAFGDRGASVRELERRLHELRYALRGLDGYFGEDDYEAVLAFQKVNGLARTGTMTPGLWTRLERSAVPRARFGGTHVEVDKTRQVLFVVRGGEVALVVHVSTGATGNTPVGLWHVYSKVPGWNGVLWYPNFFLRGFAIHGYPSVPAYPASHGCVRVPMWVAPALFAEIPAGFPVYVYV
jgi:N-acetylmuramoyl-L-alanine amidase